MARISNEARARQLAASFDIKVEMCSDGVIDIRTAPHGYRLKVTGGHSAVVPYEHGVTDANAWAWAAEQISDGVEKCPADCECWDTYDIEETSEGE